MILMTVASNWKWRGREDLPANWLDEQIGEAGELSTERYWRAVPLLTQQIENAPSDERWELLFKRAVAYEAIGEAASAREDYRASMNEDPHLRRALDTISPALEQIQSAVTEVNDRSEKIAHQAELQAAQARQIADDIDGVSSMSSENAAASDEMRGALTIQTDGLEQMVSHAGALSEMSAGLGDVARRFRTR